MEGRFSELELLFIAETLDQHGEFITDLLVEAIRSKKLISEEEKTHLIDSIDFKTTKYGINPVLILNFPDYGRFIEINYHKKRRTSNSELFSEVHLNNAVWGRENRKRKGRRKDTRWYAKNVYGALNRLIGILMYEFTDAERARLTAILQQQQNRRAS